MPSSYNNDFNLLTMVINDNNNKKENMVNNEQENYTGEHQEEGWFAKNKNVVIGICLLIAVMGFWAFSSSNNEPAALAATKSESVTASLKNLWKKKDNAATWQQLVIAGVTIGVAVCGFRYRAVKEGITRRYRAWKDKSAKSKTEDIEPKSGE